MNTLRYLAIPLAVLSLAVLAKCPPGHAGLSIKQANGLIIPQTPTGSTESDGWYMEYFHYYTIQLGAGDTVIVSVGMSGCMGYGQMTRNGQWMTASSYGSTTIFKCTAVGDYLGGSCDDGCNMIDFSIAPLGTGSGPIILSAGAALGGAVINPSTSATMRTELRTQGSLPATEPYSAMGYTFVGSGSGTLGNNTGNQYLVDWVIVELRNPIQPQVVVASRPAVIEKNGTIKDAATLGYIQFDQAPGYYYVAIRHRSHLGIMSSVPVLLNSGSIAGLNFISALSGIPTYGTDAQQVVGNRRFMWPGNSHWTTGTQSIKYTGSNNDRDPILTRIGGVTPTNTATGYYQEDVNLDGVVKYTGANNDRDPILTVVGGSEVTNTRTEQLP
jgi:hypothetical protein